MTTNSSEEYLSPCVLYGQGTAAEALLPPSSSDNLTRRAFQASIRAYSFGIGILVGVLVPLAVLTVSAFVLLHDEHFSHQVILSATPIILIPVLILNGMQGLVRSVMDYRLPTDSQSRNDEIAKEVHARELHDVIELLETRFLLGTVIGLFLAWAGEEIALGTTAENMYFWAATATLTLLGSSSAIYFADNVRESNIVQQDAAAMIV